MSSGQETMNWLQHIEEAEDLKDWRSSLLACVGFGLLLAWKHINISPTLFDDSTASVILALQQGGLKTIPLFIVLPLVLGFASYKDKNLPERMICAAASIVLSALVVLLYCSENTSALLRLSSGNICAMLSTILLLYWAKYLCDFLPSKPMFFSSLSFLICFGVALITSFLPSSVVVLIHILLPFVSGLILVSLLGKREEGSSSKADSFVGHSSKIPLRLFVGLGIVSMCIDITNLYSETKTQLPNEQCLLIVGVIVALVILAIITKKDLGKVTGYFKWVLVITVASMFFVLAFELDQKIYETASIALGGCLFRIAFYATIYEVVRNCSQNRLLVLGVLLSVLSATQFFDPFVRQALSMADLPMVAIIALMTIVLITTILFLLDEKYLMSLTSNKIVVLDYHDEAACQRCATIATRTFGFTNREEQIALLVLQRKDNVDIQELLVISPNTLKVHMRNIYKKSGVHSRAELISLLESFGSNE